MKLTIFNGSPKGKKSNSKFLTDCFVKGFTGAAPGENHVEEAFLVQIKNTENHVKLFKESRAVILAFPLYTDAMPGIVKHFIDHLGPLCGRENNPALGFVVQSGFPEAVHTSFVAVYLEKLAARLGCRYLGTIRRGGVEGIREKPRWIRGKLADALYRLGAHYGTTGEFDREIMQGLIKRERFPVWIRCLFRFLTFTGLLDVGWNRQLKKNNVYEQRLRRPYLH